MAPGLALIIGILIGAAIVYLLLQRTLQQRERALQQSRRQLTQLEQEHKQLLSRVPPQSQADYENKLADIIERYQDEANEQLNALRAEYEARIAVIEHALPGPVPDGLNPPASETSAAAAAPPIPDPWTELATESRSAPVEAAPAAVPAATAATPWGDLARQLPGMSPDERQQAALALGQEMALNRRAAASALAGLSKLTKDPDPTVRLSAVRALQQTASPKAVPMLRQALRDPDSQVVAAATAALERFKGVGPARTAKKPPKKLPKNR
jgi:type II secretory pathway pseudopilin PulG